MGILAAAGNGTYRNRSADGKPRCSMVRAGRICGNDSCVVGRKCAYADHNSGDGERDRTCC